MSSSGADILARLTKKVNQNQKDSICVFSAPGCGKTSLAAEFPGACFITDGRDQGYATLVRNGLIQSQFEPR